MSILLFVAEVFRSLQGEGVGIGAPTVFIRLSGCDLRCAWCDTAYAREVGSGRAATVAECVAEVDRLARPGDVVCVTGGEPLIQAECPILIRRLARPGRTVWVETNGAHDVAAVQAAGARVSADLKCPSSGMQGSTNPALLAQLGPRDQLKAVIADRKDFDHLVAVLDGTPVPCPVVVQPVGGVRLAEVAGWVLDSGRPIRVLPQLHKIIWGNERGR